MKTDNRYGELYSKYVVCLWEAERLKCVLQTIKKELEYDLLNNSKAVKLIDIALEDKFA